MVSVLWAVTLGARTAAGTKRNSTVSRNLATILPPCCRSDRPIIRSKRRKDSRMGRFDLHGPPDALGPNRYHGTGCIAHHADRNPYHPKLLLQKSRYLIVIYTACAADR